MEPTTEFKNFIDHYGRQETFGAIAKVLLNIDDNSAPAIYRELLKREIVEFLEQIIFQHNLQDDISV